MKLWRKLSIDWPCALGDWLWAAVVVAPAKFLDWLSPRRAARVILQLALVLAFFLFFEQIAAFHVASLFAIDANAYIDLFVAIFVLFTRQHVRQMLHVAGRRVRFFVRSRAKMLLYFGHRRGRQTDAPRCERRADEAGQSDDEPVPRVSAGYAFA